MRLDDELLEKAAKQAAQKMLEDVSVSEQPEHIFSSSFEREMEEMMASQWEKPAKRPLFWKRFARQAAVFVMAGTVGVFAALLTVDAWREQLFRMVETRYEEFSDISYESTGGQPLPRDFRLVEYRPQWIPEGYRLIEQQLDENINTSVYGNGQDGRIFFQQAVNAKEGFGMGMSINTEGSELELFTLKEDMLAYKMSNNGSQFILWNDDQYNYIIITECSMEETIKIAQSVSPAPANSYHPPKLPEAPEEYPIELALTQGCVVIGSDGQAQNAQKLEEFLGEIGKEQQMVLRVVHYTREGDPILMDLYYDGFKLHVEKDNYRDRYAADKSVEGRIYKEVHLETEENWQVLVGIDHHGTSQEILRYQK